jgi:hypothetical protein
VFSEDEALIQLEIIPNENHEEFIYSSDITFLDNRLSPTCSELVNELIEAYKGLGCKVPRNIHFLHSQLHDFPLSPGQ